MSHSQGSRARSRVSKASMVTACLTLVASMTVGVAGTATAHDGRHGTKPSCVRTLPVGDSSLPVVAEGVTYKVLVHVPRSRGRAELPLVLDLHGSNSNARVQADISDFDDLADAEKFIVATPQGAIPFPSTLPDGNWAWNVPGVPLTSGTPAPAGSRDDVAFLRSVVDAVDAAGCVDDRRVYAAGFSGGGRMVSALACEASDVFAAIAPIAGLRAGRAGTELPLKPDPATCTPSRPVAVVTFHGTSDTVNPYLGNADPRWGYDVKSAATRWAQINRTRSTPKVSAVSGSVTSYRWSARSGRGDVTLYEIAAGGHTWPGTDAELPGLGTITQEIDATRVAWDFFAAHPKK